MPMLHIKPITEASASEKISSVFLDIKETMHSEVVPLFFRYLANFDDYFIYVWDKIKANLFSDTFGKHIKEIHAFGLKAVDDIYIPSRETVRFLHEMPTAEKEELKQTVSKLISLNTQLMILTIAMREGVKGVHIRSELLSATMSAKQAEEIFEAGGLQKNQEQDIVASTKMLSPLFGNQSLMVTHYPDFFAKIALEMSDLVKTERYLKKRVELEHEGLKTIQHLLPLGCSYSEIAHFAAGKPYFNELLYILSETFPSQFPRLVVTSEVMWSLFVPKSRAVVPFS